MKKKVLLIVLFLTKQFSFAQIQKKFPLKPAFSSWPSESEKIIPKQQYLIYPIPKVPYPQQLFPDTFLRKKPGSVWFLQIVLRGPLIKTV
ncbi:hypothetical protein DYBT9275_02102 [Dyadobacter sp. CECT 9275]|uniref:Uncharacterized protein n=1 Tax=Dyadobacter helix TaxID=2822344 RepID=A0A916N5L8_9BACT|nr:hypothetical protein DYBT9275_02102 [Dyadobacter sp. CECT 9275]